MAAVNQPYVLPGSSYLSAQASSQLTLSCALPTCGLAKCNGCGLTVQQWLQGRREGVVVVGRGKGGGGGGGATCLLYGHPVVGHK